MAGKTGIEIWGLIFALGVSTYLIRLSFIWLLGRWTPPVWMMRALRYVPVAVLTAIIVPSLIFPGGTFIAPARNVHLWAGLGAILVAWKSKSMLWTILAGFVFLILMTMLVGD